MMRRRDDARPLRRAEFDQLRGELAAFRVEALAALAGIRAAVDARSGPRDEADRAMIGAIAGAVCGHSFTAAEVVAFAAAVPSVSAALVAADLDNARQLGKALARMNGRTVEGWSLERVGEDRAGLRWRLVRQSQV